MSSVGAPSGLVQAANRLTARWVRTCDGRSTAMAGVCAWPLLAALASAAAGSGRDELAGAVGMDAAEAGPAAHAIIGLLRQAPAVRFALGLWHRHGLNINPAWTAGLPDLTLRELYGDSYTDQQVLDAWAAEQTGGLVPTMPISIDEGTLLVLAGALTVHTTWRWPFDDDYSRPTAGPWAGQTIAALHRTTPTPEHLHVAATPAGPLTIVTIEGDNDVDVLLLLGDPDRRSADVLTGGIDALTGTRLQAPAEPEGPGITVQHIDSPDTDDLLAVTVPSFAITADHDLLTQPRVFGLAAVTDRSRGHFPAISDTPLAVSQAAQSVKASFHAQGFEAAAVTAIGMMVGSAYRPPEHRARLISVEFDRPFGFLAIDRHSDLILVTGWVTDPEPWIPR